MTFFVRTMSERKEGNGVIPVLMSREKSVRIADVARLDVNELAEVIQVRRRFIRNHIPNELVKSFDCRDLLCSLHRKYDLLIPFCDHETAIFFILPVIKPYCVK